jgi:hypothetical protein
MDHLTASGVVIYGDRDTRFYPVYPDDDPVSRYELEEELALLRRNKRFSSYSIPGQNSWIILGLIDA